MVIQNILFPDSDYCDEEELFFRRNVERTNFFMEEQKLVFDSNARVPFDCYFNCFSICKWKKYTHLNNLQLQLELEGKFDVVIRSIRRLNKDEIFTVLSADEIETESKKIFTFNIDLSDIDTNSVISFVLQAKQDNSVFYGGAYTSNITDIELNDIKMAINICTFKREIFIEKNIELLKKAFIENRESCLNNKLDIYIADNGKSLDLDKLCNNNIKIFPNKNAGGAGGFTRGLIEIIKNKPNKQYTHIIFMDDDVVICPESIFRTYTFLQLMKDEHKDAFIGGAMLRLDRRYMQSESTSFWRGESHTPNKFMYDLRKLSFVIKNEIEDTDNFMSWWYCVVPAEVVRKDNLPLPLFIKRDDVEYSLRNARKFITLNGILVWHEPFEYKSTGVLQYYYWRNLCIINSIHRSDYGKKQIKKQMRESLLSNIMRIRYKEAWICFKGVEDFLKGIDFLKNKDVEELHKEVMGMGYKMIPKDQLDDEINLGEYEQSLRGSNEKKVNKILRWVTLNGLCFPAKRKVTVSAVKPYTNLFYRTKIAIHYEKASQRAYITNRSVKEVIDLYKGYRKLVRNINRDYDKVKKEYHDRYREITNLDFWNQYLNIEKSK